MSPERMSPEREREIRAMLALAMTAEIGEPWRSAVADLLDALDDARAAAQQVRAAHAARLRELNEARAGRDLAKALHDVAVRQRDAREHALLNAVAARAVLAAQDAIALAASARADTQLAALKARLPAFVEKVLELGATNQYEPTDENVTRLVVEFLRGM